MVRKMKREQHELTEWPHDGLWGRSRRTLPKWARTWKSAVMLAVGLSWVSGFAGNGVDRILFIQPVMAQQEVAQVVPPNRVVPNPGPVNGPLPVNGRVILAPQFNPTPMNGIDPSQGSQTIPPRRELANALEEADINLMTEDYVPALGRLGYILRQDEDYFLDREGLRSMQEEAIQRLLLLPEAGRKQLELQLGSAGRPLVNEALRAGDVLSLMKLAREYAGTAAGEDAALWLSGRAIDLGRPWEASRWLALLPKGERGKRLDPRLSRYREVISAMSPAGAEELSKVARLLSEAGTLSADWPMVRGIASRTGLSLPATLAGAPAWTTSYQLSTSLRSQASMMKSTEIQWQSLIDQIDNGLREEQKLRIPAAQPLVSGNHLVVRLPDALAAFDVSTGRLKWISADMDAGLLTALRSLGESPRSEDAAAVQLGLMGQVTKFLQQRIYRDATWGSMSTDGRNVYSTVGLPIPPNPFANGQIVRNLFSEPKTNLLRVHELATGRLIAELGGRRRTPQGEDAQFREPEGDQDPLADGYFLGPPLPLGRLLYALHEAAGEIRLVVLEQVREVEAEATDAAVAHDSGVSAGEFVIRWIQPLVSAETDLSGGAIRSIAGLTPSALQELLICPTGAGRVVAVDPLRRQLVWTYSFAVTTPSLQADQRGLFVAQVMGQPPGGNADEESSRWLDSLPLVHGQRVILTPRESNELHCVNLASGQLLWKKPREDGLYAAGVVRDHLVLVSRSGVQAVSLENGEALWGSATVISTPVGVPVLAGEVLYVPQDDQEIVAIDAVTGKHLARATVEPQSAMGNLVAAGDRLVMQGMDGVTVFQSLHRVEQQVKELLAQEETRPAGLGLRGAMLLFRGATDAGFEDLQAAAAKSDDPRNRQLLIDVILDGLQSDFEKYRAAGDRLDQYQLSARQKGIYLHRLANGYTARQEHEAALAAILRLWQAQGRDEPEAMLVNGDWSCRLDHFLSDRLAMTFSRLRGDARQQALEQVNRQVAEDVKLAENLPLEDRAERLLALARVFGMTSPEMVEAMSELIKSPIFLDDPVVSEQWLSSIVMTEGHPLRGLAVARWMELLTRQGKADWAVKLFPLLGQIEGSREEFSGAESLVALQADGRFLRAESKIPYWNGVITDTRRKPAPPGLIRRMPIEQMGGRSLLTDDWNFEMDASVLHIVAVDPLGNFRWQIPTSYLERDGTAMNHLQFGGNMRWHQVFSSGSLLVFPLGGHFTVVDPLSDPAGPRILWQRKLLPNGANSMASRAITSQVMKYPNGRRFPLVVDQMGLSSGQVHGVSGDLVIYQIGTRLFAASITTGEIVWSRQNLPRMVEVTIDEKAVTLYEHPTGNTSVYGLRSGDLLTEVAGPISTDRLWQRGSEVVSLVRTEANLLLSYHNWLQPDLNWTETLPMTTSVAMVEPASRSDLDLRHGPDAPENRYPQIATLDAGGQLRVIERVSKKQIITSKIDEGLSSGPLIVRRKSDQYLVVASQEVDPSDGLRVIGAELAAIPVDGMFYGIDAHTGGVEWMVSVPQTAIDPQQLGELPISVFWARVTQPPRTVDGRVFLKSELRVSVVDHRTGQLVYGTVEPQTTGGYVIQQRPDDRRLVVHLFAWMLEMDFAPIEPGKKPGERKLPEIIPADAVP
ncbi:hypothetical protein A6X21_17505 [Planctopirus hydrillae]|uniref:Pyrrolo-quinoline quinone repeat domain-containing protein n=2 Tax=Planctopirus hydrillae TaxID=1841610 RepID=A0A1C3ELS2_9PLAN|nr:hypothetical protein A6X21_17505 [Planctopirus hydrillae]